MKLSLSQSIIDFCQLSGFTYPFILVIPHPGRAVHVDMLAKLFTFFRAHLLPFFMHMPPAMLMVTLCMTMHST